MSIQPPARSAVLAVLVTYHPDGEFPVRLRRLLSQTDAVIVDNGSAGAELDMLRGLSADRSVSLIRHDTNLGIAEALNRGARHAMERGYAWALLLDQDTEVDADIAQHLLAVQASCPERPRVAVVGSRFRDTRGRPAESLRLGHGGELWEEVESVITSGSLLSLTAYAAIGPFRTEFFIDHVDTEFCMRARAAGYRVIESRRPLMSHTVGMPTSHQIFGSTKWTTHHSPDRRYYIARNNTVLLREYGTRRGGSWRWKSFVRCIRLSKRIVLFEDRKSEKIRAVWQGWRDALRGQMGPRRSGAQRDQPAE